MNMPPSVCFVGMQNLPVLAREYNMHGIGGEEVQQTLLARALARRGYSVSMVVRDYGQPDGATWGGVRVWKAYSPDKGVPAIRFVYPRWWKLIAALRHANPDVIYLSCAGAQLGQVALWARLTRRRIVFRVASDRDCMPASLLIPSGTFMRDRMLYEYGLSHANVILVQTETQRQIMLQNYALPSILARMLVSNTPPGRVWEDRDIDVLWVNNHRALKRPDLFLELARQLEGFSLHMVGGEHGTEAALYEAMKQAARSLKNLTFHGKVPYQDVNDLFSRAKVFVNTSDTEGFPNSYLQAWIRGVPVVAFFDPDGLIGRQHLGIAVETLPDMKRAVLQLLTSKPAWSEASMRCTAYMAAEFDESEVLQPYLRALGLC